MKRKDRVLIGTRGSKLAMWQAEWVKSKLEKLYPDLIFDIVKIKTTGDKILDVPLAKIGGKGLFVKEIEEALLRQDVDIAVHSMKDVPTDFLEGLHLAAICEREDPSDSLVLPKNIIVKRTNKDIIFDLPQGARIGTSSLRRLCQLLNLRPDFRIEQLRGNLDTRLRKLDEGQYDAIVVATAGLKRLGLENRITEVIPFDLSLPAIGQGAIGIECRVDDEFINDIIKPLNHLNTSICVRSERAFLKRLEGGCQVPIAAHATLNSDLSILYVAGLVGDLKGERMIKHDISGNPEKPEKAGIELAEKILEAGAKEILDEIYGRVN